MKIILAVLLLLSAPCWAQQDRSAVTFSQEGQASQELRAAGLQVRHPSLPIGSKVMVQNMSSGNEVEVTVVGRIQVSPDRIVDLSADVAQAIGLQPSEGVRIYISQAPAPAIAEAVPEPEPVVQEVIPEPVPEEPVAVAEAPAVIPEPPPVVPEPVAVVPEPVAAAPEPPASDPQQPIQITLHTYIVTPENPPPAAPPPTNTVVPREDVNRQQAQPAVSATNNPELNWLAWLSYMTALSQAGNTGTVHVWQQQSAPQPVQASPPSAQYIPIQSPPPSMQYVPLQSAPPPVQNNSAPVQTHTAPVQAYTAPAQTHTAPAQAYTAPAQTHTAPAQTHTTPVQNNTPAQIVPTHGHTAAPVPVIRVIPYMPDPDSDIVYQLQLGAYSSSNRTSAVIQYLREAGFTVIQERTGDLDRVVITGISAPNVYNTIQRLGTMGFAEIWIRD